MLVNIDVFRNLPPLPSPKAKIRELGLPFGKSKAQSAKSADLVAFGKAKPKRTPQPRGLLGFFSLIDRELPRGPRGEARKRVIGSFRSFTRRRARPRPRSISELKKHFWRIQPPKRLTKGASIGKPSSWSLEASSKVPTPGLKQEDLRIKKSPQGDEEIY